MKPIGEILIEHGIITPEQLTRVLKEQRNSKEKKRLGEILIEMGFVTESDIVVALSTQFNFPYLPLKNVSINRDLCKLVPLEFVHEHCLIPVDKISDLVIVVSADPADEKAIYCL